MDEFILARYIPKTSTVNLPVVIGRLIPPRTAFKFKQGKGRPIQGITGFGFSVIVGPCPYCNYWHRHGWAASGEKLIRTRKSHCTDGGEYRIYLEGEKP